jgi:DNA mismatch repair protein MutS
MTTTINAYRYGDFYEAFREDAVILAKALTLTLTNRRNEPDVPMCGFPAFSAERYLADAKEAAIQIVLHEGHRP